MAYAIVRRRFSETRVRRSVFRILEANVLCSVSTVTPANRAHINTAYFCYSGDLELFFLSAPFSTHSRNLAGNPSVAIAVFSSAQAWGKPDRGIQLFGTCLETRGRLAKRAERLYAHRFPTYARWMRGRSPEDRRSADGLRSYRFYRFRASRVKIIDERVFGGGVFVVSTIPRKRRPR